MYEPTWSQPFENYQQTGSYIEPATPPPAGPDAGTLVQLPCVNDDWLPLILGALDQLRNPSSWLDSLTDPQRYDVLGMADRLRQMVAMAINVPCCDVTMRLHDCVLQFSVDGGVTWVDVTDWAANFAACVQGAIIPTPPLLPPGSSPAIRACNIASYLANDVIHEAITQAINAYDNDLSLLALAGNIAAITFAFDLPWTAAFIYGVYDLYAFFTAANIADLRTAEADATLWADVTCAIYNAIHTDGAITDGNCAAVISNICSLSYTPAVAVSAICAYVTRLGCNGLKAAQTPGALNNADCSGCGAPCQCIEWQWYTTTASWVQDYGGYTAGSGYVMLNASVPHSNYMRVHASLVSPVRISDVWVGVGPCGAWTAGGTNYRRLTLLSGSTIVAVVSFPVAAYSVRTKVHSVVPLVTFDNMVFEFVEDFGATGGNVAYLEFLIYGTNPFGTPCCTD